MSDLLFSHARVALKYGLKSFNLSYEDLILVPDFICEGSLMKLFVLKQTGKILSFYQMRLILIPVNTYVNMTMVKRKKREDIRTAD